MNQMSQDFTMYSKDVFIIAELIFKFHKKEITCEEQIILDEWLNRSKANMGLFEELMDNDQLLLELRLFIEAAEQKASVKNQIFRQCSNDSDVNKASKRTIWARWVVAASIIFVMTLASYMFIFQKVSHTDNLETSLLLPNDVAPGSYKAKLTLADGSIVVLDSAVGELAKQGNVIIKNENGQLVYDASTVFGKEGGLDGAYNVLSTSTGESYTTTLSDGSKIWLNSGSSVRYPVAFSGNERVIEASGEIFLEVTRDAQRPF
jgi:transmembrane sensor